MSTYKTKNPLGSAAVKDLYDNAENVDKFVNDRTKEELEDRLGVLRKTWHGMEMIFSRFIDYITGRGEQAVAAIGWQELGNWAVGLAVDNRQQIVYYNGSWYKYLGELEHVIAGDSPENDGGVWSAANPTGKWSNIGDAALRSNLGSGDGLKMVGRCASLSSLRLTEPAVDGQWIVLEKAIPGGQIINEILTYDAADTVSPDNGYSVFVTANGRRWKADLSKGYNPLFLLGAVGYESISSCINKIAYDLAVLWGNKKGVIDYCTTIRIQGMPRGETRYNVTGAIHIPSFVSFNLDVDTCFDYYGVQNTDGIIIDNSYFPMLLDSTYDTSPTARPRSVLLWEAERQTIQGGKLTLTHPTGAARTSNAGITIGNTANGFIDVRGCCLNNFASLGFYYGIKINPFDNYINSFSNFHLGRNHYAVAVIGDTKNNAGERFAFFNGTLADSDSDLIYIENNAFELFFTLCSCDYSTGDLVKITKNGNAYMLRSLSYRRYSGNVSECCVSKHIPEVRKENRT